MIRTNAIALMLILVAATGLCGPVPTTINDFFLPGSQPTQSGTIENPDRCNNCHGGYDQAVEPTFNWQGSMMAQAARDPLFYACLTIAEQDAPASGDLCIRCHSPKGWLEERSTPTDGSALTAVDREGVQCDFCHRSVKPAEIGENPFPNDPDYTSGTYPADQTYLATLDSIPEYSANGMFIVDSDGNTKRGPFVETVARHQFYYSPFHSTAAFCGTCHDVSNPAFSRNPDDTYSPNDFDLSAPSFNPYDQFPIERTYSEWLMSSYNTPEGVYAPQFGGNKDTVHTCQDCHLRDVTGAGCDKNDAPIRDNLPFHDMTGGNTFIPKLIDAVFPGEANLEALDSGIVRAESMLRKAATMDASAAPDGSTHLLNVNVINETGHKLPSGYPEGRRIWINVRAYNESDDLIYESGAYDTATGDLTHDADVKIYEVKPGIAEDVSGVTGYPVGPSFHFAVNSKIYFDNRIPPRGFTNANFDSIQSPPVGYTYADGEYWDDTEYSIPGAAARIIVTLYYQTTSREYVEFLRDENVTNDWGDTLYSLWAANGKSAPVAMNVDTVDVTPLASNSPPSLATIGDKTTDENVNLSFTVSASDPDGETPSLSAAGLPTGASFTDHNDGTGTFDWTPTYDQSGIYPVTFIAEDTSGAADSEIVDITVNNVNRPPTLATIGDKTTDENVNLSFTVTASDPDGTTPDLTATGLPTGASFTDHNDGTGTFDWTPTYDQAGIYPVVFHATDDSSAADSETIQITVNDVGVNDPPVIDSIGEQIVDENSNLNFIVSASDPDGPAPVLTASTLPAGASFTDHHDGTATFDWTPGYDQSGIYPITFVAEDDSGAADSEAVDITVNNVNRPPELDLISSQSVSVDSTLSFDISASDPDGTIPTLAATSIPVGADFTDHEDGTGTFTWIPASDQTGLHQVVFHASDGEDADSQQVDIQVLSAYYCGDANGDGEINVGDATYIINYVFKGGPAPDPVCIADANADGGVNVADAVYLINFIFKGGPAPVDTCCDM